MRRLLRTGLTVLGLALAVPVVVSAEPPTDPGAAPRSKPARGLSSWFRRARLCTECQRAELAARGIQVPPAPALPQGVPVRAEPCDRCGGKGVGSVTMMPTTGPVASVASSGGAPGYAVVGGPASAPGYAAVGRPLPVEPTPIGRMAQYGQKKKTTGSGRTAPGDSSVMASNFAAPEPMNVGHNRPHVISHALGLSAIGRSSREAWDRRKVEAHARIPYGTSAAPVTELPASVVYRNSGR